MNAALCQVQHLLSSNRTLSEHVSLLHDAVKTLSRAASCGNSMMSTIAATLDRVKQLWESNPTSILNEVVTNIITGNSKGNTSTIDTLKEVTPSKMDEK